MDPANIGSTLSPWIQLGSFGVLMAFFWHVVKVQIPRADERADARELRAQEAIAQLHTDCAEERRIDREERRTERVKDREDFTAALAHQRGNYLQAGTLERAGHEREIGMIVGVRRNANTNGGHE